MTDACSRVTKAILLVFLFCAISEIPRARAQQPVVPIPDSWMNGYPQYHMGLTYTYFNFLHEGFASGTVVLPRAILTAGHIVFEKDSQSWATEGRFMRWNHGSTGWPYYNPVKWPVSKFASYLTKLKDYKGLDNSYESYNHDLGGMVFPTILEPDTKFMKITAASANSNNTKAIQNSVNEVRHLLEHKFTKSVMCYKPGYYSLSDPNVFKLHETLPYGKYIFKLPSGAGFYDALGYPTMWYRSKELTGSGGCSGGSLQRVNPDETRTLLGVVISNSSTNGLGIRALDASGIFLVKIMSII